MSWLGLLLLGLGVADLGRSLRPVWCVPECVGAATVVVLAILGGLTGGADVCAWLVAAAGVVGWGAGVRMGACPPRHH